MKRIFCIVLLLSLLPGMIYLKKRSICGFKLQKIYMTEHPPRIAKEMEELEKILDQPFYYLDRGTQSYVFESADGQHVLKWFRYDRIRPSLYWRFVGLFFPNKRSFVKKLDRMHRKIHLYEEACWLAFTHLKKETALVYIHPFITSNLNKKVQIVDPIGRKFEVDLDRTRFAVQRRAQWIDEALMTMENKEQILISFSDLLDKRLHLQIGNKDPDIFMNFGFLDGDVCEIDFGDYFLKHGLKNDEIYQEEKDKYVLPMLQWMKENFPERHEEWKGILQ